MERKQRKTCLGCRALSLTTCELGFKTRTNPLKPWQSAIPLEPCPKPTTYQIYFATKLRMREEAGIDTLKG